MPLGRLVPVAHFCTVHSRAFRQRANTGWLTCAPARMRLIAAGAILHRRRAAGLVAITQDRLAEGTGAVDSRKGVTLELGFSRHVKNACQSPSLSANERNSGPRRKTE